MKRPIDIGLVLRTGGVDGLMKVIEVHEEIPEHRKEACKRAALAEILILGNLGRRGLPAEVASAAAQLMGMSLDELVMAAKVAAQKIPKEGLAN